MPPGAKVIHRHTRAPGIHTYSGRARAIVYEVPQERVDRFSVASTRVFQFLHAVRRGSSCHVERVKLTRERLRAGYQPIRLFQS